MIARSLTAMILTFDEAPNIERTLDALTWLDDILIVDSGSTDATLDIARRYPQVRIVTRPFDSFAGQCNFGLTQIAADWVLSLDADYVLTEDLSREIMALPLSADVAGYVASFVYVVHGAALRAALYPPRCILYRRSAARYRDEGHGHRVAIDGKTAPLAGQVRHDDRKPLQRWLKSQLGYARREADYLLGAPRAELGRADRLRLMCWPAPLVVLPYTLLFKRCLLDGWPGWLYALQRCFAEILIALEIVDRRLDKSHLDKSRLDKSQRASGA